MPFSKAPYSQVLPLGVGTRATCVCPSIARMCLTTAIELNAENKFLFINAKWSKKSVFTDLLVF